MVSTENANISQPSIVEIGFSASETMSSTVEISTPAHKDKGSPPHAIWLVKGAVC